MRELIKYTEEEVQQKVAAHQHWLAEDVDGWEEMRADFTSAYLRDFDFSYLNLQSADFSGSDLSGSVFYGTSIRYTLFDDCNLHCASFKSADAALCLFRHADCTHTMFDNANLYSAAFRNTDLRKASFYMTNLEDATIDEVNLDGVMPAYLYPLACPSEGSFVGWKKVLYKAYASRLILPDVLPIDMNPKTVRCAILKLIIPADARRSSATSRKCRCDKAIVIEAFDANTGQKLNDDIVFFSQRDNNFIYKIGKTVSVDDFDTDRWHECSSGIHFLINRQEAVDYQL